MTTNQHRAGIMTTGSYDREAQGRALTARRTAELAVDPFAGIPGADVTHPLVTGGADAGLGVVTETYEVPEGCGLTAQELEDLYLDGDITNHEAALALGLA